MPDSGGIGNQWFNDRAGIHARTLADAARVLDAIEGSRDGLLRSARSVHRDAESARFPSSRTRASPSATQALKQTRSRSQGVRIAILREHMVKPTQNHEAI